MGNGEKYYSLAIWTPLKRHECWQAFLQMKLYFECESCGYVKLEEKGKFFTLTKYWIVLLANRGDFGAAKRWMRPPGFAHPIDQQVELPVGELPKPTRSTRAKLSAFFGY